MDDDTQKIMATAESSYRRDMMFRRYVDAAVHEAMRHVEHLDSEADRRDFHNVAIVAAMAVLQMALEGDHMLKAMEFQRDAAMKQAESAFKHAGWSTGISIDTPPLRKTHPDLADRRDAEERADKARPEF